MNSDPRETAAWRAFGMLDADEASAFDEAVRLDPELRKVVSEMNGLTTAVAVVSTVPVPPRAGEIDRLRARLGLGTPRRSQWTSWSGWAAAAVLALLLVIQGQSTKRMPTVAGQLDHEVAIQPVIVNEPAVIPEPPTTVRENAPADPATVAGNEAPAPIRVETKRLIQEIEVLRGQLANFQKRDRERFSPVPGVAWPIVIAMHVPSVTVDPDPAATSLNTVLGDALAGRESLASGRFGVNPDLGLGEELPVEESVPDEMPEVEPVAPVPTAVPIYDSARDAGTLVVGNLPVLEGDEAYNLWVRTADSSTPVHVGKLPQTVASGAEALDFSLGSTGIVPTGFILTRDVDGKAGNPAEGNTILQGP